MKKNIVTTITGFIQVDILFKPISSNEKLSKPPKKPKITTTKIYTINLKI